jgi:hypothetical protein
VINRAKGRGETSARLLMICLSVFLLGYAAVRAARLALTCDEAHTYLEYIAPGPLAFFRLDAANNHFLNSLLAKLSSLPAGTSELALRLPNLLALAAYLLFSFLILDRFIKRKAIVAGGFVLLAANPYLLDFFSLCRGYGISLACLMASLCFFFVFLESAEPGKPGASRQLGYSLGAASLGVLANLTLLDVYLGIFAFATVYFAVRSLKARRETPAAAPADWCQGSPIRVRAIVVVALVVFNLIVIAHDPWLVGGLFKPVTVRIQGSVDLDLDSVEVFRLDPEKTPIKLSRREDHWEAPEPAYISAIRLQAPADVWPKIRRVEVGIGAKTVTLGRDYLKRALRLQGSPTTALLTNASISLERSVFPAFRPAVNWPGDGAFLTVVFLRLLLAAGIGVLAAALTWGAGTLLGRWLVLRPAEFRPLAGSALMLFALVGYSLYSIEKSGGLYWGGKSGFIRDTVFSLIHDSFYGRVYFRGQEWAVFAFACSSVLAFMIALAVFYGRGHSAEPLRGLALALLLAITWGLNSGRHALFGTPYLLGRTGLFCVPVFTLLFIFLTAYLSGFGQAARTFLAVVLGALVVFSAYHFVTSSNTSTTVEWRPDADTKAMLLDLQTIRRREFSPDSRVSLAVDWRYCDALKYYRRRDGLSWLIISEASPIEGREFYYGSGQEIPAGALPRLAVVKTYRLSKTFLARLKPG